MGSESVFGWICVWWLCTCNSSGMNWQHVNNGCVAKAIPTSNLAIGCLTTFESEIANIPKCAQFVWNADSYTGCEQFYFWLEIERLPLLAHAFARVSFIGKLAGRTEPSTKWNMKMHKLCARQRVNYGLDYWRCAGTYRAESLRRVIPWPYTQKRVSAFHQRFVS